MSSAEKEVSDEALIEFATEEQFLLFVDEDSFVDIARAVLGRFGRQHAAPDVRGLVTRLNEAAMNVVVPADLTPARAEYWKAGARASLNAMNSVLSAHREQQGGEV